MRDIVYIYWSGISNISSYKFSSRLMPVIDIYGVKLDIVLSNDKYLTSNMNNTSSLNKYGCKCFDDLKLLIIKCISIFVIFELPSSSLCLFNIFLKLTI